MAKIQKSELKKLCDRISDNLDDAYEQLQILSNSYKQLMRGDGQAYWDGNLAHDFYEQARKNIHNDIIAYKRSYEAWSELNKRYKKIKKADRSEAIWS